MALTLLTPIKWHPIMQRLYFGLTSNGSISPGYAADFVILDDVNSVKIHSVYKKGKRIDDSIDSILRSIVRANPYVLKVSDTVRIREITADNFKLNKEKEKVIGLVPGEILTNRRGLCNGR